MKTMKLILVMVISIATTSLFAQNFEADLSKSQLKWTGTKVGGSHWGYISLKSAMMKIEDNKVVNGTFVIDMNSLDCQDLESKEYNAKLVGHLKSDDFFGVDAFPEAKLVVKESTKFIEEKATLKADLTIKGKTHPIEFVAMKDGANYTASIIVDRSKYDVKYGSKSFFDNLGDKVIYDEFTLDVSLVAK
jgi:polyisoprenoid-binding protein YceI